MTLEEAMKKVQTMKVMENYWLFELQYDTTMVLSHKDGISFMESLARAEQLQNRHGEQDDIIPLKRDSITIRQFSRHEYEQFKMAGLLKIQIGVLRDQMNSNNNPPQ